MAIQQTLTTQFKYNLFLGVEDFSTGSYKIALYTPAATIDSTTTAYTSQGEITGAGYTAGGKTLIVIGPSSDASTNTAYVSFQDVSWTTSNFTASGALIYNAGTGASICVLSFGGIKTTSPAGTFPITFPANNSTSAVIRIS